MCYILYIFLCAYVCDSVSPSTGQLIFMTGAHGVPCEVRVSPGIWNVWWRRLCLDCFVHTTFVLLVVTPVLQIYLHFRTTHFGRTSGRFLETIKERNILLDLGEYWITTFKMFSDAFCIAGFINRALIWEKSWIKCSNFVMVTVSRVNRWEKGPCYWENYGIWYTAVNTAYTFEFKNTIPYRYLHFFLKCFWLQLMTLIITITISVSL
jgi:hypothetical protein